MKKYIKLNRILLIGLVACCLMGLTACGNQAAEPTASTAISVEAATVALSDLENNVVLSGYLKGGDEVVIMPKTVNTITRVDVKLGDTVKAGQVLVVLSSAELQAQLASMQAQYNTAKSAANEAAANYERMKILYAEGAISQQQMEQAKGTVDRSGLAAAAAGIQQVREQINNCTIKAPIDGVVATLNANVGEIASQQAPIAVVSNMKTMELKTTISEANVGKVKVGQTIPVRIASVGEQSFEGTVKSIAPAADSRTMTFPISITMKNDAALLRSGMFAEATVATDAKKQVLSVPRAALVGQQDFSVYVINSDNTVTRQAVTVGLQTGDLAEILTGVSEGASIVTKGQHLLSDGVQVKVVGAGAENAPAAPTPESAPQTPTTDANGK